MKKILFLFLIFSHIHLLAQVGIGTDTPDGNSIYILPLLIKAFLYPG